MKYINVSINDKIVFLVVLHVVAKLDLIYYYYFYVQKDVINKTHTTTLRLGNNLFQFTVCSVSNILKITNCIYLKQA